MLLRLYNLYTQNYHFLYVVLLSIFAFFMPHSRGLLSSSQIALAILWLLDVNFKAKINKVLNNKALLLFLSIFFIHILALAYTSNYTYALKDLRVKLPLLLFPLVIASSQKLSLKEIKLIISVFTVSVFLKTLYGLALILGITSKEISDLQQIAGRMSHIRYSLLLNIIIFSNFYFLFIETTLKEKKTFKILRFFSILWMTVFVFILQSVTGWVVFFVLSVYTGYFIYRNKLIKQRFVGLLISFSIPLIIFGYLTFAVSKYLKTDEIDKNKIEYYTKSGNKYKQNFKSKNRENGHFVNIYLCEKELSKTWNKISKYKYSGKDEKKQFIKYTLIRYLTSKNLRKDKEGVLQLTKQDISNIESGMANYIFENKYSVYPKLYEVFWQIEHYFNGGSPQKHSVTQRFEFIKIAKNIIRKNFWIGVGTGDVGDAFKKEYKISKSKLSGHHRLRAHNQYITFFITFGLIGFIWILFVYIYPAIILKKFNSYLFLITFITITLSMLNEDTTETQMGATIFAFFLSFFLFSDTNTYKKPSSEKL